MASESKGIGESLEGLDLADSIKKICAHNARASLDDDNQLLLFLQSWWSRVYNRPLKDPLLLEYTLEELLHEFYDRSERAAAEEERVKAGEVQEETAKEQEVLDWAEEEEKRELEAQARAAAATTDKPVDPAKEPDNIRWMDEQIRKAKAELGDDFGSDLELNFDEE
jgi:hypothetical protein